MSGCAPRSPASTARTMRVSGDVVAQVVDAGQVDDIHARGRCTSQWPDRTEVVVPGKFGGLRPRPAQQR